MFTTARSSIQANGTFSLVEADEPTPGLSLIPGWDTKFWQVQPAAPGAFACRNCGFVTKLAQGPAAACPQCAATDREFIK